MLFCAASIGTAFFLWGFGRAGPPIGEIDRVHGASAGHQLPVRYSSAPGASSNETDSSRNVNAKEEPSLFTSDHAKTTQTRQPSRPHDHADHADHAHHAKITHVHADVDRVATLDDGAIETPAGRYNAYAQTKRSGCVPGSISPALRGPGADLNKHLFQNEPFGVFVEFGAGDGIFMSNSLPYEENLCWSGVCIEPTTEFAKLQQNRPLCAKIQGAVCDRDGPRTFHDITENGLWTGWAGFGDTFSADTWEHINANVRSGKWAVKEIKVYCHKLQNALAEQGIRKVDHLAIDVQGAEYEVLFTIDFKVVIVDVLQVFPLYIHCISTAVHVYSLYIPCCSSTFTVHLLLFRSIH
jgi:FkbM family methyltransferase